MKFIVENTKRDNITTLSRKIGYIYIGKTEKQELNIIRPLERGGYPRFHVYLTITEKELSFNLHLDQRRPVYKGAPAHSADYDGKVVEQEAERIKQLLR
ncbi:MAG: hypothetical protein ACKKMP_03155 [Candidatus Nealsonbacteria bacterium]